MNDNTLLFRQVHPAWVQQGRVTSRAFKPTPKDQGKLSVYDGDQISADAAWMHFTNQLGLKSAGVLALTVVECTARSLSVFRDPQPFLQHVVIDFSHLNRDEVEKISKLLRADAEVRGWLFQPGA